MCLSEALKERWEGTWCNFLVLGNCQLKALMQGHMTCFWITLYLGVVPFKITYVIAMWPFWTRLSILSVCACLPHKKRNFSGQRYILFASGSLHLALSLAHTHPWWSLPSWGNCKCEPEESRDMIWPWFCTWRTKAQGGWATAPSCMAVSEGQGLLF